MEAKLQRFIVFHLHKKNFMGTMTVSPISPIIEKTTTIMAFRDSKIQPLMRQFGLIQKENCPILEEWLQMDSYTPATKEKEQLRLLRKEIQRYGMYWNEMELQWNFISKLIDLVDYKTDKYHFFLARQLETNINNIILKGRVDGVVASGIFEPEIPYFCFHEYKQEQAASNDPIAQLLSAMLAAQQLNNNKNPVYGCLVLSRNWFFLTLKGKEFCISNNFSSTHEDELDDIFRILKNLKVIIETQLL